MNRWCGRDIYHNVLCGHRGVLPLYVDAYAVKKVPVRIGQNQFPHSTLVSTKIGRDDACLRFLLLAVLFLLWTAIALQTIRLDGGPSPGCISGTSRWVWWETGQLAERMIFRGNIFLGGSAFSTEDHNHNNLPFKPLPQLHSISSDVLHPIISPHSTLFSAPSATSFAGPLLDRSSSGRHHHPHTSQFSETRGGGACKTLRQSSLGGHLGCIAAEKTASDLPSSASGDRCFLFGLSSARIYSFSGGDTDTPLHFWTTSAASIIITSITSDAG